MDRKIKLTLIWMGFFIFIIVGFFIVLFLNNYDYEEYKEAKLMEKVEKYIHEEKYAEAYTAVDVSDYHYAYKLVNKILKSELATLIQESDGDSNFAKILFAIKERGSESDYEYVIEMAEAIDNTKLSERFKAYVAKEEKKKAEKEKKEKKKK